MNSEFSDPMDSSLLQLERELQSLTPAAPGRDLLRSLQACMEPAAAPAPQVNKAHTFPWKRMVAPAAAAAAAVAVMSINNNRRNGSNPGRSVVDGHSDAAAIKWEPMPMRSEYRALLDAGYVLNENMQPVRQFYMNTVDHHEWHNASDNSSVRLTIPRQQRFLMPAGEENEEAVRRLQFQ